MANDFFSASGNPATGSQGSSAAMRAEFESIEDGFDKLPTLTGNGSKIIAVNSGGTALEPLTTTGSGSAVRATSPTLVTPTLGVASATSINGTTIPSSKTLVVTTDKLSALAATTSSELASVISDETGSGSLVFATSPTLTTPNLGTPSAIVLTNASGTASININGTVGATTPTTGAFTTLTTSSTNTLNALTASTALALNASKQIVSVTNTGSGDNVLATSPTLVTPALGVATATSINGTSIPSSATLLTSGGALGTPSSGTVTNLTGTASININGTVGATTPSTGVFTKVTVDDADFNLDIVSADTPRVTFGTNSYVEYLRSAKTYSFYGGNNILGYLSDTGIGFYYPMVVFSTVTATGVFTGPDGSASAPTYSFSSSGNSDNGMYLSAADTVAIASAGALASSLKHTPNNTTLFKIVDATTGITSKTEIEFTAGTSTGNITLRNSSHLTNPGAFFIGGNAEIFLTQSGVSKTVLNSSGEFITGGTTDQGAYNLQCNGTAVWGAGAYVNGSDARIKEDVSEIESGLDVVAKMKPVKFRYKESWSNDNNLQPGFIAQELKQALDGKDYVDGVVHQGPEYMSVAYQTIVPILVKAVQEQQSMIDSLKSEVALLKSSIQ